MSLHCMKTPSDPADSIFTVSFLLFYQKPQCAPSSSYFASFSPFIVQSFSSHPCSRAPLTERQRHAHMSHQFMEISIVFGQCATLRGLWVTFVLILPQIQLHIFTQLSCILPHMQSNFRTPAYDMHVCICLYTLSHTLCCCT